MKQRVIMWKISIHFAAYESRGVNSGIMCVCMYVYVFVLVNLMKPNRTTKHTNIHQHNTHKRRQPLTT